MDLMRRFNNLNKADAAVVDFVIGRLMGTPIEKVETFIDTLATRVKEGAAVTLAGKPVSKEAVDYLIDHIRETGGLH